MASYWDHNGDELNVGDEVTHLKSGAGTVLQLWNGKAVVQFEEDGVVTVALNGLARQAPLPLDELAL
jgi:hypothetical protein